MGDDGGRGNGGSGVMPDFMYRPVRRNNSIDVWIDRLHAETLLQVMDYRIEIEGDAVTLVIPYAGIVSVQIAIDELLKMEPEAFASEFRSAASKIRSH
jgi:hypothetical protein